MNRKPIQSKPPTKPLPKKRVPKAKGPIEPAAPLYPMRINKFLAHNGYSTRRGADELIEKRWVTINGQVAVLGDKVNEMDMVEVRNNKKAEDYLYYAFNKPRGIATEKISASKEFFPVLSLDTQAEGLVIVTNDRRIIDRLTNPAHSHMKEYLIKTVHPLRPNFKEKMEGGVTIGNNPPIKATVNIRNDKVFTLRITDAGTHVRQMCSMFFAEVESLTRTRILNIELGSMKVNERREIKDEELALFLKTLGL